MSPLISVYQYSLTPYLVHRSFININTYKFKNNTVRNKKSGNWNNDYQYRMEKEAVEF